MEAEAGGMGQGRGLRNVGSLQALGKAREDSALEPLDGTGAATPGCQALRPSSDL